MLLRDLVAGMATVQRGAEVASGAGPELTDITGITDDSRRASPGCLFVARPGARSDGRAFVADAIARGAVAVLYDDSDGAGDPCPAGSAVVRVRMNPRRGALPATEPNSPSAPAAPSSISLAACRMAERLEGDPSEWLGVVGVTGTNGKTTTAFLVQQLVHAAGKKCGVIGTVLVDDGERSAPAELTTPSGIELSAALGRMVRNGCAACAMEVSSHALHQGRASALRFRVGVFTNLTGDHLDYHQTMEHYAAAKAGLFAALPADGVAIVNADDPWHERMLKGCRAKAVRCSVGSPGAQPAQAHAGHPQPFQARAVIHAARLGWQDVEFEGPFGSARVTLPLVGAHNAMNALQAAVAAHALGVPAEAICSALAGCVAPPGRLQPVTAPGDPFAVLVDYAHTDDALLNVLTALRPLVGAGGRLTTVFGCGGDRDRTKRPRMMRVACTHSDQVIVTSDNPRTEQPEAIIDEVMAGRPQRCTAAVHRQADRERAITAAVQEARAGDIVIIAGKGHEDYQIVGTTKRSFDDCAVALAALGRCGERTDPGGSASGVRAPRTAKGVA